MYFNLSVDVRKSCKASVQTRFKQINVTLQPKLTCVYIIIHFITLAQHHDAFNITGVKSLKVNTIFKKKIMSFLFEKLKLCP